MYHDVLAGLLPTGNPLAPFDPASNPAPRAPLARGGQFAGDPQIAALADVQPRAEQPLGLPAAPAIDVAGPIGAARSIGPQRRGRFPLAGIMLGLTVIGLFAAIAGALAMLVSGVGVTTGGQLISQGDSDARSPRIVVEDTAPRTSPVVVARPPRAPAIADPVMGGMAPVTSGVDPVTGGMDAAEETDPPAEIDVKQTDVPSAETTEDSPAGQAALDRAAEALRSGDWERMAQAVQAASDSAATAAQRERADQYGTLVELAAHYREGIRRGAAGLAAAESFELIPGLRVVVVESSREKIAIRFDGRVKSYAIEDLPLVLAHRLSEFALPADDPVAQAARAAYQILWGRANDSHRQQAIEWMRQIPASGGVEFAALTRVARDLFGMPTPSTTE